MNLEILFVLEVAIFFMVMLCIGLAYCDINRKLENMEDMWNIVYRIVIAPYIKESRKNENNKK